ncbi:aspartate kinase [Paraburkholderia caribensis]|uniref:amino acid kinase family protein n=1 Tax=Paraburkholderia caribensis TaxID=75105 RepID=UPI000AA62429|nr:aspartate kinase [Paraburkholderia caribensis]
MNTNPKMNAYETPSVMKFGGSSFATTAHLKEVCDWLEKQVRHRGSHHRIVCVVSAPSGLTEQYRETLLSINPTPTDRLIDAGLPLADSLGAVLVAAQLQQLGLRANVVLGNQVGIRTDRNYARARLLSLDLEPLRRELVDQQIIVVPGGQASAQETGETTWMGKNSSDMSAIALAIAFGCEELEIFSDVPGIYSSDPNIVTEAHVLPSLSHGQAVRMSMSGAKILHHRGVSYAERHGIRLVCRANGGDFSVGTVLTRDAPGVTTIVPDARSQVFAGNHAALDAAVLAFQATDVPYLRQREPDGREWLAVTCGFFDALHFLRKRGIELELLPARVVSVITASGELLHQLVAPDRLPDLARALHAQYVNSQRTADEHQALPAQTAEPLSKTLSVFPRAESVTHV